MPGQCLRVVDVGCMSWRLPVRCNACRMWSPGCAPGATFLRVATSLSHAAATACRMSVCVALGQGYDGSAVRAALRDAREAAVHETGGMTAADARARMLPNAYVRLHSPPRVPLELTGAARNAAVALALVRLCINLTPNLAHAYMRLHSPPRVPPCPKT